MANRWVLFNFMTGDIIRENLPVSEDKIILDTRGDDSADITMPISALSAAEQSTWRADFKGWARGIAYIETTTTGDRVVYAGPINKPIPSVKKGHLRITSGSVKSYYGKQFVANGDSVTNSKEIFTITGVSAAGYLNTLISRVNNEPNTPDLPPASGTFSGSYKNEFYVRDMVSTSVEKLIDDVADDPAGCEMRWAFSLSGSRIVMTPVYPVSGERLLGAQISRTIDFTNTEYPKLSSVEAGIDYSGAYNILWNEVRVDTEGLSDDEAENLIDIKKVSAGSTGGMPALARYVDYGMVLTPEERAAQNAAYLSDGGDPMESWEIIIHDETKVGDQVSKTMTHVDSWLGNTVSLVGTPTWSGINGDMRVMGMSFSTLKPTITIQVNDKRVVYPKLPKRLLEKKKPAWNFKKSDIEYTPKPGGGTTPVDPGGIDWDQDWGLGTENNPNGPGGIYPFGIYGFDLTEQKWTNPYTVGTFPDPINDMGGARKVACLLAQDESGAIYSAHIANIGKSGSSTRLVPSNMEGLSAALTSNGAFGLSFDVILNPNTAPNLEFKTYLPETGTNMPKIILSSGYLGDGEMHSFVKRAEVELTMERIWSAVWSEYPWGTWQGGTYNRDARRTYFIQANRGDVSNHSDGPQYVNFTLTSIAVHSTFITLEVVIKPVYGDRGPGSMSPDDTMALHRKIVIAKGSQFDTIYADRVAVMPKYFMYPLAFDNDDQQIGDAGFGSVARAGTWALSYAARPQGAAKYPDDGTVGSNVRDVPMLPWNIPSAGYNKTGNFKHPAVIRTQDTTSDNAFLVDDGSRRGQRIGVGPSTSQNGMSMYAAYLSSDIQHEGQNRWFIVECQLNKDFTQKSDWQIISKSYNTLEESIPYEYDTSARIDGFFGQQMGGTIVVAEGAPLGIEYFTSNAANEIRVNIGYIARAVTINGGTFIDDLTHIYETVNNPDSAIYVDLVQTGGSLLTTSIYDNTMPYVFYYNGWLYLIGNSVRSFYTTSHGAPSMVAFKLEKITDPQVIKDKLDLTSNPDTLKLKFIAEEPINPGAAKDPEPVTQIGAGGALAN